MKSAIAFIKFIIFMLFVAWLASCTNKHKVKIAEQQRLVKFDIDLLHAQITFIGKQLDNAELQKTIYYSTIGLSQEEIEYKRKQAKKAEEQYAELDALRSIAAIKQGLLQIKYDSLQVEYLKY